MKEAPITVLIADDHPIVREHVAGAVSADERLELVGEAGDGEEVLRKIQAHRPKAVVLDVAMPILDGAAVLKRLRERRVPISVLLLSGHASVGQMRDALRYYPDSLLLMDADAEEICEELVAIERGEALSPGRVNLERAQLLARHRAEMSRREWDVLKLSAEGLTRAEIGERLHFAPSTVRDVRRDICTKLGAPSMQVAIVVAMRIGLLD
ncbi:MAG TPA: response regulator transcription factor [Solirubrobacterales bacterium]|nr:response regulator transcription factor [Solirubrobacterales bacterium]